MMLTNMNIGIIGGDARQIELIKKCSVCDANLFLIGYDQLDEEFQGARKVALDEETLSSLDALILPIVGLTDDYQVESLYSSSPISLTAKHMQQLPQHCVIYTGMASTTLEQLCLQEKLTLVELLDRDDLAIYNSIPTVEGTLMLVIQETDITIHQSNTVILGFGRVGMSVARTFHSLGANVSVGARKTDQRARIYEMGMIPFDLHDLSQHTPTCDVLINTIPAPVVTAEIIAQLDQQAYIVDLASKPGGTDFRFAEKRGIKATLAPGLPGIVAPKTAGQILATVVVQLLAIQVNTRRDNLI